MHSFILLLAIIGFITSSPADVDVDSVPKWKLDEFGDARWWCPASNWGKTELEWPKHRKDTVDQVSRGTNIYVPASNYQIGSKYRRLAYSIGRLETFWWDGRQQKHKMSVCTAAIVGREHIVTNHHCVTDEDGAVLEKVQIRTNYLNDRNETGEVFQVEVKTIELNKNLDYALLGVYGYPFRGLEYIEFLPRDPEPGEELFILEHPAGLPLKVVTGCNAQNEIKQDSIGFRHNCATEGGSSGSLIFSARDNSIIGLHFGSAKPEHQHEYADGFFRFSMKTKRIADQSITIQEVTPRLDLGKRRPVWFVVGSTALTNVTQSYMSGSTIDQIVKYIDVKSEEGFVIHDIHYSLEGELWSVVWNKVNVSQSYKYSKKFGEISDWIKEKQDQGLRVTNVAYGEGYYFVTMEPGNYETSMRFYGNFPAADELIEMRSEGWVPAEMIFDVGDSEKPWLIYFVKYSPALDWALAKDKLIPWNKISEYGKMGYVIYRVFRVNGEWTLVFYRPSENTTKTRVEIRQYFPSVVIREMWNSLGMGIYQLVPSAL